MKKKIISSLKKYVYLIDDYDDEHDAYYYMSDSPILKKYRCIGKLKDLTDKDCEGLVEGNNGDDESTMWFDYTQPKTCFFCFTKNTPKESFLSALEAEGLYLNGNPIPKKIGFAGNVSKLQIEILLQKQKRKWQEAEQNVFSPETLIFVEQ